MPLAFALTQVAPSLIEYWPVQRPAVSPLKASVTLLVYQPLLPVGSAGPTEAVTFGTVWNCRVRTNNSGWIWLAQSATKYRSCTPPGSLTGVLTHR